MLKKKVMCVLPIYLLWWGAMVFCELKFRMMQEPLYLWLLRPHITVIAYPLIAITYICVLNKIVVLESVQDRIKFNWINVIAMVYLIIFALAPYV